MFTYAFLQFYLKEKERRKILAKQMHSLKPHRLISRRRGEKMYFSEVSITDGKRHEQALPAEEYYSLALENFRYRETAHDLKECDKFLKHYESTASKFRRRINKRYSFLSKQPNNELKPFRTFHPESAVYCSQRGEIVRSKSEEIIADLLFQYHIDYVYESACAANNYRPDFYIENNVRGIPVIWEHFGMLSKLSYQADCMKKIDEYAKQGFFVGYNLIITYELYDPDNKTVLFPFDSQRASKIVREWFLPIANCHL